MYVKLRLSYRKRTLRWRLNVRLRVLALVVAVERRDALVYLLVRRIAR